MSGSGWSADGGRGERIEGQGGLKKRGIRSERFWGDWRGNGESVVQIMVYEYRDP
jgi:hypothetical protein